MKAIARLRILGIGALVGVFALGTSAQTPAAAPASGATEAAEAAFTSAQLEQLAAPIALYPDSLISQIMMASTYPLEVVQAARWVKANPSLKGKELEEALKDQDWDIAVKAMCGIPDALRQMNDNLDWTQDLGDAFLAQRADLLDAVQRMRGKAYEAGSLKTTEQQTVTQQPDKIIVIQSADPQVVYVPTYSPTVVYGGWSYPSYYYPSMYYPPPYAYGYGYGAMAFTAGVFWGAALSGGCNWGWGGGDVDIDINRNNEFNRNTNRNSERTSNRSGDRAGDRSGDRAGAKGGGKGSFQHNPAHRGGVNYRDNKTAQNFGGQGGSNRVTKDQARGYDRGGAGQRGGASATNRAAAGGGPSASNRAASGAGAGQGASNRAGGSGGASASNRAASGASSRQTGASSRGSSASSRSSASSSRNSAYSGSRNSGFDRSSSSRGSSSRSGGYSGGRGGGGGGGRGGGGGGGRRR